MLFVVETEPDRLLQVVNASPSLKQLVDNRWIRLSSMDPATGRVHVHRDHGFEEFDGPVERLPAVFTSDEWYRGKLEHLGMAWIQGAKGR
jgi:hypothetical protein